MSRRLNHFCSARLQGPLTTCPHTVLSLLLLLFCWHHHFRLGQLYTFSSPFLLLYNYRCYNPSMIPILDALLPSR